MFRMESHRGNVGFNQVEIFEPSIDVLQILQNESITRHEANVEQIIHIVHTTKIPLLKLLSTLGVDWRHPKTVL